VRICPQFPPLPGGLRPGYDGTIHPIEALRLGGVKGRHVRGYTVTG
jgi:hypothetical protein